jgi:RNA polymerase sigma-70 factor (ECF subfamily)
MSSGRREASSDRLAKRDEKRLIDKILAGDQGAARRLIDAHKDRLHAFIWRVVRDHHDAEELAQETFLKAFSKLDTFSAEYRFSTWLFTIAYRLSLNSLRRHKAMTGDMDFGNMAGSEAAAETVAQSEETRRLKTAIWDAVDRLSVPQRAAVLLFYREEQSCQDIAEVLGMPVATIKSHLHRARGRLQEILSPVVGEDWTRLRLLSNAG